MCDEISCGADYRHLAPLVVDEQSRRAFMKRAISLPLAMLLADPLLAASAATDVEEIRLKSASGEENRAFIAYPEAQKAPALLLVHEWWGVNDQIKTVAREFAREGFLTIAVDLYHGAVATTREEAVSLKNSVKEQQAAAALVAWVDWLRHHPRSSGKVGTLGWCYGGGWSLTTSLLTPVEATVIYYGNVEKSRQQLATLKSPILGHFGTQDEHINQQMVTAFETELAAAGKTDFENHWYDANHAFANPTGARYDAEDAALAWSRTLTFLHKHLNS
ncbi:MAG: dienelactone hydrolase family protein [Gammaproteobacteria bacterium]|nr:dienelactone hydrolase family protein [Gammaproteobacteria bacterium]